MFVISQGSTGRGGAPHQQWRRILWSCRDTFRVQIGRLLVHTLSPALPLSDRKEALEFVFDPRHLDILKESLSPGLEVSETEMPHYNSADTSHDNSAIVQVLYCKTHYHSGHSYPHCIDPNLSLLVSGKV